MSISSTAEHSRSNDDREKRKELEMLESEAMMEAIAESSDPRIRYRWRRPVTDIRQMLKSSAAIYGNKPLFMQKFDPSEPFRSISYRQVGNDVDALGTALIALGLKGKHVGVVGKNSYEWAETYLAVVGGVGIIVPLDKEVNETELATLTTQGELAAVIADESHFEIFKEIKERDDNELRYLIGIGLDPQDEDPDNGILSWEKLRSYGYFLVDGGDRRYLDAEVYNNEVATILFTSGTTGVSKGVMLTHKNLVSDVMIAQTLLEVREDDIFFSVLPIHHTYECTACFLETIYCGATIAFCRGLKYITKDMQEVRPTIMLGVPLIFEKLYGGIIRQVRKSGNEEMLSRILRINRITSKVGINVSGIVSKRINEKLGGRMRTFISGGASIDPTILDFFNDIGIRAVQGYGLTECSPIVALNPDVRKDMRNASAGYVFPFVEAKIDSPNQAGVGEICFRGPVVMAGYYKNEEATEEALRDGWFYTGDLGYLDPDNYVYITGRKKNVIITANGKNVFPEEIESYVLKSPYIRECMVWGDEDDGGGVNDRRITATLIIDEEGVDEKLGSGYDRKELYALIDGEINRINSDLPVFKRVGHFVIRTRDFNKTTAHKIRRFDRDNRKA